ncbi:RidA family protein [Pseudonocardia sp.]|uniref:RidA family protein n=1 Tax=Pseudonocardia sp. TaxID=60912 RepID=UPI002602E7E4|nr:RidA family protein [Pseudonocardia sp.]MCW2718183.1 Endoribonuclease [Pseudonocardia sp.]MDT7616307.1 2-iminobutanoate/2-iminopropanoate deaminase [Pseudonocardiales bacterium]
MTGDGGAAISGMNPRKSIIDVPGTPPPFRPYYSNAVRVSAGDLLYVSGQVAWDDQGRVVGVGDGPAQARQAFDNVGRVLVAHGASWQDVLKVTVFVTEFEWFDELSALRERLFPEHGPASTIVRVAGLVQPELLIEVEAVVAVGGPR